jgi:hypothetical protein
VLLRSFYLNPRSNSVLVTFLMDNLDTENLISLVVLVGAAAFSYWYLKIRNSSPVESVEPIQTQTTTPAKKPKRNAKKDEVFKSDFLSL